MRIPDPTEPPYPYNFPVSDNEDVKMLILLVQNLKKQIEELTYRIEKLESQKVKRRFP